MPNYITEETYHFISKTVYINDLKLGDEYKEIPDWKIVKPQTTLHDSKTGFDAEVFRNENTNQIIIGYRGTEPGGRPIKEKLPDLETDVLDVVMGRAKQLENTYNQHQSGVVRTPSKYDQNVINEGYKDTQFYQAEELYRTVKKEYPTADITTTGHSLGGGLAEYVAARNDLSAVTYDPADILPVLSDDIIKRIDNGDYKDKIYSISHPGDIVSSGIMSARKTVGTGLLINNTYEEANSRFYVRVSIPDKDSEYNFFKSFLGLTENKVVYVPINVPFLNQDPISKFLNSFGNQKTHDLNYFQFDEHGFITNKLFTTTDGQPVNGNLRFDAYLKSLVAQDNMKKAFDQLLQKYGSKLGVYGQYAAAASGVTIQLSVEDLKAAGQKMEQYVQEFQSSLPTAINSILRLVETSRSRSLEPIMDRLTHDLHQFSRWYEEEAHLIAEYINKKAEDFRIADEG
ncbi:lipase family protein [Paenibacillus amylolyticus]|uniref:lipase family protein n=1 Tax=Paenibacillus amylolyticus TaxID=1451 RepID=UPI0039B05ED6